MMQSLASEFFVRLVSVFERGGPEEIISQSEAECALMRSFAEMIVDVVSEKYPEDDDKNDDAALAVVIADRVITRFVKAT